MKKGGGEKKEDRRRRGWITWRGLRADVNSSFHPNRHYFYKQTIPKVSADPLSPRVNGGGLPWTRALTSPRPVCTLRPHDPAERKISASFLSANRFNRIKRGPTPFETLETEFQELATGRNISDLNSLGLFVIIEILETLLPLKALYIFILSSIKHYLQTLTKCLQIFNSF